YYFVGIGGISVSALAEFLFNNGFKVKGSDLSNNNCVKKLKKLKITVYDTHRFENITDVDVLVYSSAIDNLNPEIIEAKRQNIPTVCRSELLGSILADFNNVLAVAGSHGKTTTTAMLTEVFASIYNPTAFIGGESITYGNYKFGERDFCITEACEYQKNLLNIKPTVSILLNADYDHVDTYKNVYEVASTFKTFSLNTVCIKNADDVYLKGIPAKYTFALTSKADFTAKNIKTTHNGVNFNLYIKGKKACKIFIPLFGKHNVLNALSVIAAAIYLNVPLSKIKTALASFKGINRRNELLGKYINTTFYADYAHHPKEIIKAINLPSFKNKKTLFIFEPHTYSRTKILMNDFVDTLIKVKNLAIYKTYPAREHFDLSGDALTLLNNINAVKKGKKADYFDDVFKFFNHAINFDKVVILGAGSLYDDVKRFLN
ncbi:MAG: UDP-N-acetylmuramate--L-alanine ligase, partial [Clostridia bacterium]|nr:UDP-N-acetylmuramate--L-alanine ligase [Clostridia bacterium]